MPNLQTLKIVPFESTLRPTWDAFVRGARNGHFFFQRGYLDYHRDRFEDSSLLVYSGDRLLALLPANVDGSRLVSHQGLTFGGFVVDHRMTGALMVSAFRAVLDYLRGRGVHHVVYKAIPHIYHREPTEEDLYALHLLGARLVRRDLSSALALGDNTRYSKGKRLNLARAEDAHLTVARSDDFGSFTRLLESVLEERHHVRPSHTAAEMELLARRFPDNIQLYCVHSGGVLIAGGLMFVNPSVVHTQYVVNSPSGRDVGALDFLLDRLIRREFSAWRYLSFGISTEDEGRRLNEGLLHSKEAFGARAVVHDFYELSV
jgi:hypothetical protein